MATIKKRWERINMYKLMVKATTDVENMSDFEKEVYDNYVSRPVTERVKLKYYRVGSDFRCRVE